MMALRCGAEVNSMVTLFNGSVLAEGQTYRRHARGRRKNTVVRGERFVNQTRGVIMTNDEIISTLNELIETSKDGEHGFKTCAENVKDMGLKQVFTAAAQRCAEGADELQDQVRLLGGDPDKYSSVAGTLHRAWVDIKAAITGKDEQAVLEECERGEDVAKKTYEEALAKGLPDNIRSIVQRQYLGVVENHDRVRDLRNRYRKAN